MKDENLMAEARNIYPIFVSIRSIMGAHNLTLETGCMTLTATILSALEESKAPVSDKRDIASTIIRTLAEEWFPEILETANFLKQN